MMQKNKIWKMMQTDNFRYAISKHDHKVMQPHINFIDVINQGIMPIGFKNRERFTRLQKKTIVEPFVLYKFKSDYAMVVKISGDYYVLYNSFPCQCFWLEPMVENKDFYYYLSVLYKKIHD